MTDCTSLIFDFPACRKRRIEADFSGGDITSNGGVLLLRQADRLSGLTASVAGRLSDARQRGKVEHRFVAMLRQRVFGLALGYEDVNDHADLRHDLALQTAAERDRPLASPSTLSRFENAAGRAWAWSIHEVLVDNFIASHSEVPKELILDFDATDDAVHGKQEGRFFHGYYDHYCFLPLYVFCGERLLVSYLRRSKIDGAKHAWAILSLLVKRLRQAWPDARIIFRGDSGFCRYKMLSWCERHGVGYITGLAKNVRLNDLAAPWMETAAQGFADSGVKQRLFGEFRYAAGTWKAERRVIARIEHGPKLRWLISEMDRLAVNFEGPYERYAAALKPILAALERTPFTTAAAIPDPAFAVIEHYWTATKAYDDSNDGDPDAKTIESRFSRAREAFLSCRPTTAAGMAAKTKAMAQFYRTVGHDPDTDVLDELAGYFHVLACAQAGAPKLEVTPNDPAIDAVNLLIAAEEASLAIDEATAPDVLKAADMKAGDAYYAMLETPVKTLAGALAKLEWLVMDMKTDACDDTAAHSIVPEVLPHIQRLASDIGADFYARHAVYAPDGGAS